MKKIVKTIICIVLVAAVGMPAFFGILYGFFSSISSVSFSITSISDLTPPIISVTSVPKNFFVTQSGQIDAYAYATAFDNLDGDITPNLEVTANPQLDYQNGELAAGNYTLTFTVSDSAGNAAQPANVTVTVWDFVKIVSGYYHTLALTSNGRVYVWGYNAYGQLGDGTTTNRLSPVLLEGLSNIVDVAAGVGCSYALDSSGQIYAWGRNENGRLGDGTTTPRNSPVAVVQPGLRFKSVSSRFMTAGAISDSGDVYTWGYGGYGAAGTGNGQDNYVPTKIALSNVSHLEMGYYNGAAVTDDCKVFTWGDNLYGQLGSGKPMAVGTNAPSVIEQLADVTMESVSVGFYHMAATSRDGRIFTWGYGYEGRLGGGGSTNQNTPQEIFLGEMYDYGLFLKEYEPTSITLNRLYDDFTDYNFTMADGLDYADSVVATDTHANNNYEVVSADTQIISPAIVKAVAGYAHTAALTSDGRVFLWGQNLYGKLGNGNTTNSLRPILLESVQDVRDISLGMDSSFVLQNGRTVFGMGYGLTGVLGTGVEANSTTPLPWSFTPPDPY